MKRFPLMILFAVAMTSLAGLASAQGTPGIDRREIRQQVRIREGMRSGELTRGETLRLRSGQRHIRFMERRVMADGVMTPRERARISAAQNHQSRAIWRLKHNRRMRMM